MHSCCPGLQHADPFTRPSPAIAGLIEDAVASCGVFALAEGAVGDLAQQAGVVVQGANIASVDRVGVGVEMVVAEGFHPFQHPIDLALGGKEGIQGFGVVGGAAGVHGVVSGGELHRSAEIRVALVRSVIN